MFDNINQHKIVKVAGLDLMAGVGFLPQPVIGLADVIYSIRMCRSSATACIKR